MTAFTAKFSRFPLFTTSLEGLQVNAGHPMRQPDFGVIVIGGEKASACPNAAERLNLGITIPVTETKADKWGLKQRSHMMPVVCAHIRQGACMHQPHLHV